MIFNSFQFLWLFPIIFITYYAIAYICQKRRIIINLSLIAISYGLYLQWNPVYALILLFVTFITFLFSRLIEISVLNQRKWLVYIGVLLALMPLFFFKYYTFVEETINDIIGIGRGNFTERVIIAPLGISFYTFQALGYLFDVYYGRIKAEKNWLDYMLFVCFFPQILSGPISKAKDLLPQIKSKRAFDYNSSVIALKWFVWGLFLKVAFADRLGIFVDMVYTHYEHNSGLTCLIASVFYSFQIYGDFAGYSLMAMGVGKLLGFNLVNNFNHPYLSFSITDFWRRWHISLSTWLKDYVYIPMGGSRCLKLRNYWNIFITFLVSGIWHGANWTFIIWGIFHGFIQIVEKAFGLQKNKPDNKLILLLRIIVTFCLVNFAWIVFRLPDLSTAAAVINKIFTDWSFKIDTPWGVPSLFYFGPLLLILLKDIRDEYSIRIIKNSKYRILSSRLFYFSLLVYIILFGVLDSGSFIYASF